MCIQTKSTLYQQREFFLRDNLLFSLLICETYNVLTSRKDVKLSAQEIYMGLSPFLKDRMTYVFLNNPQAKLLFSSCDDIVAFVVSTLADQIDKIKIQSNYYYIQ